MKKPKIKKEEALKIPLELFNLLLNENPQTSMINGSMMLFFKNSTWKVVLRAVESSKKKKK